MAYQPVQGYFMPSVNVRLYLDFLCSCFLGIYSLHSVLLNMNILKQIYLNHTWKPY